MDRIMIFNIDDCILENWEQIPTDKAFRLTELAKICYGDTYIKHKPHIHDELRRLVELGFLQRRSDRKYFKLVLKLSDWNIDKYLYKKRMDKHKEFIDSNI